MAAKNNIRSIRMSDQVMEYIEAQTGENFTQKFEAMVLRCMYELPAKEAQIKELDEEILEKRRRISDMSDQIGKLSNTLRDLSYRLQNLEQAIARETHSWDL